MHVVTLADGYTDSEEQKSHWEENPLEYQDYCKGIENELNQRYKFILNGTPAAEEAKKFSVQQMKDKLGKNVDVAAKVIPTEFGVGCRRPTVCIPLPFYFISTNHMISQETDFWSL